MNDTLDQVLHEPSPIEPSIDEKTMLLFLSGPRLGERITLEPTDQNVTIGRDEVAEIVLGDDSISRTHCVLSFENNRWFIRDLKSTNGTYVAHQFVDRAPLENGDLIAIGRTIFRFFFCEEIEPLYREEVHRLAIIDSLTQIHNRRYLLDFLEREISRCRRRQHQLSVIMFEVVGFTGINQRYGHLSGDHVLREVATRLVRRVRREEVIARSSGHQFTIVLPETGTDEAQKFAEIIEHTVSVMEVKFDGWTIPVNVRTCVCELSVDMKTPNDLLAKADRELTSLRAQAEV